MDRWWLVVDGWWLVAGGWWLVDVKKKLLSDLILRLEIIDTTYHYPRPQDHAQPQDHARPQEHAQL